MKRRTPASALTRVGMISSPPGRTTRANSSIAASGFGTARQHVLRHHHVERIVGEFELLGIHHREALDILQAVLGDALLGLLQHRFRNVGAEDADVLAIERQRDAGADADFEHAAADLVGGLDRGLPALAEHAAEHEVVDRRPAVIGLLDRLAVEVRNGSAPSLMISAIDAFLVCFVRLKLFNSERALPAGNAAGGPRRAARLQRGQIADELTRTVFPGTLQREIAAGLRATSVSARRQALRRSLSIAPIG